MADCSRFFLCSNRPWPDFFLCLGIARNSAALDAHPAAPGFFCLVEDLIGPLQPLVLVNEHAKNTADLLAFKAKIVSSVQQKFGITLTQEPELLP